MDLGLDVKERNGWAVLSVQGEVDVYTAPQFREQLIQLVDQGQRSILVDLEGVEFLDSTGLGVLVGGLKRVRSHDGDLALVCTQRRILKVLEITGLTKVFTIHDSVDAARRRRRSGLSSRRREDGGWTASSNWRSRPVRSSSGIARMAVGALAGIRPGLAYERIDDLRIVVSEACTSAIEGLDDPAAASGCAASTGPRPSRSASRRPARRSRAPSRSNEPEPDATTSGSR